MVCTLFPLLAWLELKLSPNEIMQENHYIIIQDVDSSIFLSDSAIYIIIRKYGTI